MCFVVVISYPVFLRLEQFFPCFIQSSYLIKNKSQAVLFGELTTSVLILKKHTRCV